MHGATKNAANIDVLDNGIFKPRPKLAESSSRQARLAPSQLVELWMDKERPRPARVGGLITASAASPKV